MMVFFESFLMSSINLSFFCRFYRLCSASKFEVRIASAIGCKRIFFVRNFVLYAISAKAHIFPNSFQTIRLNESF